MKTILKKKKKSSLQALSKSGFLVAQKINKSLNKISDIKTTLIEVTMDKHNQLNREIELSISEDKLKNKVIILVDHVL